MNNGADNAMASATLAAIANGGGNGSITMEQLLAALTQVVGKQRSNDSKRVIMKNKETQTTTREERWDKPVAKSKVDGNDRATTVRNYRTKKEVVSGTKKAISSNNSNCDGNKPHPAAKKTAGKQKTPPSKKATEEEKGDDNSRGKEADGAVNGEPERCDLVRGHKFGSLSCLLFVGKPLCHH